MGGITNGSSLGTDIAVSELADGTDGELITWDSSGVATTVAVGTSGQVLTSNGAGAEPTFQDAAGGASKYDATVGSSGADYTDINAAITGVGGTDIKLLLITDITEDSDIAIPSGANLLIDLSSYTLTMGTNQFTYVGNANVCVVGNGPESGAEIDYTYTTSVLLFANGSYTSSIVEITGITVDNNSSAATTNIAAGILRIDNSTIEAANTQRSGANFDVDGGYIINSTVTGGGTSCYEAVRVGTLIQAFVNNVYFDGTFSSSANNFALDHNGSGNMSNINFNHSTNTCEMRIRTNASNIFNSSAQNLNLAFGASGGKLMNANLGGGICEASGRSNLCITNLTADTLDMDQTGDSECLITGCRITSAVTINGDRNKISNSDFLGGATVSSGANDNGFVNCQFGADLGSGALTLTIDSGSNRTRVLGCMTDAAISDSGTGTTTAGNVVY